jgi:hypothetical protein
MKKLALVLVAGAIGSGASHANISTGFFAGAQIGYGSTNGKYTTTDVNGNSLSGSTDIGGSGGNIGVLGGYGWVEKRLYMGAEVSYTFEQITMNNTLGDSAAQGGAQLKRSGYFNMALRCGYLPIPNILFYIRVGGNFGTWKFRDTGIGGINGFTQASTGSGAKNRLTFVPGFGLETAIHQCVYLRLEYVYEFGPSVKATNSSISAFSNVSTIRNQSTKLGVVYKF